jgi:hypothetical protein
MAAPPATPRVRQVAARGIALLVCLLVALPQSRAQDARGGPNAPNVGTFGSAMTRYYETPTDVAWLLADWEQAGGPSRDAMMGFLAGLFAKHPEQIKVATVTKLGRQAQVTVIQGLLFADRHPEAIAAAKGWNWPPEQMAHIKPLTPLRRAKPTQPGTFDILWAASFATGDEAYVRPIYDFYDAVASTTGVDVRDMVAIVLMRGRRNKEAFDAIKQKYPQETLIRVISASSALWSLESNARQHKFVATALDRYVKEKPGSPASEGVAEMRKAAAAARPAR